MKMKTLTMNQLSQITGGTWQDVVTVSCAGVAAGNLIYPIGISSNWWNAIGWISAVLAVADLACGAYTISGVNS